MHRRVVRPVRDAGRSGGARQATAARALADPRRSRISDAAITGDAPSGTRRWCWDERRDADAAERSRKADSPVAAARGREALLQARTGWRVDRRGSRRPPATPRARSTRNFKSKEELFLVMLDERFRGGARPARPRAFRDAGTGGRGPRAGGRRLRPTPPTDQDWPKLYFQFVAHAARNEGLPPGAGHAPPGDARSAVRDSRGGGKRGTGKQPPIPIDQITAMIVRSWPTVSSSTGSSEPELSEDLYATMGRRVPGAGWRRWRSTGGPGSGEPPAS